MSKNKFKAILFDNDGTLVDTQEAILASFTHAMKTVIGVEEINREEYSKLIGLTLWDQFARYYDDQDTINALVDAYRAHNKQIIDDYISCFDGLQPVLEEMYQCGNYMGVVTSKMHQMTLRGLKTTGIDKYFSYIQGCDDFSKFKPDPEVLTFACKMLELDPKDVLYIGDSPFDMHSGNGAGCKTAAVLWGVFPKEDLLEENPDYICEKPADLLKYI